LRNRPLTENEKTALREKADDLLVVIRWLESHKEYLRLYPATDSRSQREHPYYDSPYITAIPAIDCAKCEHQEFMDLVRFGKSLDVPYENPFENQK
jgi:hypothetical protein